MTLSGAMLTETMIDLCDQHTLLPGRKPSSKLSIESEQNYQDLHRKIKAAARCPSFVDISGSPGKVLDQVCLGYSKEKFWHRFVDDAFDRYPIRAWSRLLPLEASLKPHVGFPGRANWAFTVSPKPRAIIYPFGWSTWLSLRIVGAHSLPELAEVVDQVFNRQCIMPDGSSQAISLDDYFEQMANGVRADAFAGKATADVRGRETLMVITVLAKHGSSPSLGALTPAEETTMLRLVRPTQQPSTSGLDTRVRHLLPGDAVQYALREDRKYFLWVQSLLRPDGRNHDHLRCYHNNTFRSLERAGQLQALIDEAGSTKASAAAIALADSAAEELRKPRYKGALVRDFINSPEVQKSIEGYEQPKSP